MEAAAELVLSSYFRWAVGGIKPYSRPFCNLFHFLILLYLGRDDGGPLVVWL